MIDTSPPPNNGKSMSFIWEASTNGMVGDGSGFAVAVCSGVMVAVVIGSGEVDAGFACWLHPARATRSRETVRIHTIICFFIALCRMTAQPSTPFWLICYILIK